MAQTTLSYKIITLVGAGSIASVLFWMALYLAGPEALIAGVIALVAGIAWLTRGARSVWALVEGSIIACLVAGQASILLAALVKIMPVVLSHAL